MSKRPGGDETSTFKATEVSLDEGLVEFEARPVIAEPQAEISMQEPTHARDVMTKEVATAPPEAELTRVAALMRDANVGIVPIVSDETGQLLGVITDRDIVVRVDANAGSTTRTHAADVMTRDLVTVHPDDDLHEVIDKMGDAGLQRILVVDDRDHVAGIISVSDLAQRTDLPERVQDTVDQIARHRH